MTVWNWASMNNTGELKLKQQAACQDVFHEKKPLVSMAIYGYG